ncbi:MAG: TRAP transporter large permease [Ectothiorhodospiraceae bacterium]|nr:TRAP transporter large permease [Ectothiorhodospiraceae bacterium]
MIVTVVSFFGLILIGAPIVFALGLSAALTLHLDGVPMSIVAQRIYAGLDSFTIMAIPFFVFAGIIMERGGIAQRIIDFAAALVGWITGSLLLVSVVAGTGLAAISGSGSADTAATSSIMLPEMRRRGYDIDFAAGIMAAAGTLGPVIPPSIMMVVLATISNLSVGGMFLGGVVPGLIMALGLMLASYLHARRGGDVYREDDPFTFARLARTFVAAGPAFLMPVIIVGGIVGGVFTPTEAAAVAVFTGLLIAMLVYREIGLADLPEMILKAAKVSAAVMMIIATASIFSWLIASQNVPALVAEKLRAVSDSPWMFLLMVNLLLILIGMFMESISAILILVPVLMPIARDFGIDPLHFGVVIIVNLSIGMITPPYGITLFVASSIAERSIIQVSRKIMLPLSIMLATLLAVTYVPSLVTYLPELLLD